MAVTVDDIIGILEDFAPLHLQEDYDNAGLQIGDRTREIESAMVCLDVTRQIVHEAKERGCKLIISHHPLLFKGLKSITGRNETESIVIEAIKNDIAIYSAHTNLDSAWNGVSHIIASKLGVQNLRVLQPQPCEMLKLCVFVPLDYSESVKRALFAAGAGKLGNYDCCSYSISGKGSYRSLENANPFIGEIGKLHTEDEERIEVLVPTNKKSRVVKSLIEAHPYEEPAFDLVKLENDSKYTGLGVVGDINPMPVSDFLEKLKNTFHVGAVRYSTPINSNIEKVAICGGSGASLIPDAIRSRADIYISGDIKYHDYTTWGNDILIADIGHYESEQCTKDIFCNVIRKKLPNFALYYPDKEKNPINYL